MHLFVDFEKNSTYDLYLCSLSSVESLAKFEVVISPIFS